MAAKIQLKRATAAAWAADNPTLAAGEIGVELDTLKMKVGNGTSAWGAIGYVGADDAAIAAAVNAVIDGAPNALNTLKELATALGNDANYATTITTALASKANSSDVTTSLASKANATDVVSKTNGTVTTASTSATVVRNITLSTSAPSGGSDGDVWIKYTA